MAYEIVPYVVKVTLVASADLTAHQYKFVKLTAGGQAALCSAVTDVPVGVLQNAPRSGEECEVVVLGGTKVVAAASASLPAVIGTNASGLAAVKTPGTDTTHYSVGQYLTAPGGANEVVTAIVDCSAPGRAS